LFPDNTRGFIVLTNINQVTDQFNKTQLGKLMTDPVMEPFSKDLQRQFDERWSGVRERFGLTWDDLKTVAGGETALGLIQPGPAQGVLAVVIDATGRDKESAALRQKISANMKKEGATETALRVPETAAPVTQFVQPKSKEDPDAPQRTTFYCTAGAFICAAERLDVLRGILGRLSASRGDSLADVKGFQVVMRRCANDLAGAVPQVRWFIHPLGYAEAVRAITPEDKRRDEKSSILKVLRNQGFSAIQGTGGFVDFATEGYELVHRSAVWAPKPWENAMKMFVFPNGRDFAPQRFVPRDIASYYTFYADILNAFDNFGPLFDELAGEGERGVWADVLEQLEKDPNGPKINLRRELVEFLGQRVSVVTDYHQPITPTSERLLFVFETLDEAAVSRAIRKMFENDKGVKRHDVDGQVIWELIEEQKMTAPKPPVVSGGEGFWTPPAVGEDKDKEEERTRLLPHAALTVSHGQLFVASHLDFLLKILQPREERETLPRSTDYRRVDLAVEQLGIAQKCARLFSRTDEEYRPTYELLRQGKMPQSETVLGRVLNNMLGSPDKKGQLRKQELSGKDMPDYDVVRRYLGPSGMVVTSEGDDAWFLKGFLLKKE
jgi:hypothetical protein